MLMNYIKLENDVPATMHFTDDYILEKDILDEITNRKKRVRSLVFEVDYLDSIPCHRTFSIISDQLAATMQPYLVDKKYRNYDFRVSKSGSGFTTRYKVEAIPRP